MIIQFIFLTSTNRKTFNQNLFYIFFDLSFNLECISFFIVCISCKILKFRYIGTAINPTTRIIASNSLFSATSSNSIIFATNKIKASRVMRLIMPKSTHHPTNKNPTKFGIFHSSIYKCEHFSNFCLTVCTIFLTCF